MTVHLARIGSLFERDELYGGEDEGLRFVAFARAVAARCAEIEPDVLVAHDWQAALSLCVLRTVHDRGTSRGIGAVQVVHNNAHQGRYPADLLPATGLPGELFAPDGLEFHGELSLLKGGLAWADRIVAVSPSYAEELETPAFGEGLEGLYQFRSHRLVGIANGIDAEAWDPGKDAALPLQYDRRTPASRAQCREALIAELGLDETDDGWLLGAVGRLAHQKGWDVLAEAAEPLLERGASLVLLGSGDAEIARELAALERRWPRQLSFRTGWNEALARRIYAGVDSILIPSRFEPCGLVQLLAQRYGALPIAHAVGGLRDTIRDGETGILFSPLGVDALLDAVEAGAALRQRRGVVLVRALLALDVSWNEPAERWEAELTHVAEDASERV
ncbi:MAG: glycogen synthase [Myxococcales bacterium]|nr:glycogen synthase [Myxococcales bacterium]